MPTSRADHLPWPSIPIMQRWEKRWAPTDHAALRLSLVQAWEMNFAHYRTEKPTIGVKLPARSLLLMNAEERYDWQHGITTMLFIHTNSVGMD